MDDEIICQHCGRPNLREAEKCWYCQSPIPHETPEGETKASFKEAFDTSESAQPPVTASDTETNVVNEDIPEWLSRIRALKAQEIQEDEERTRWQQQALFAGKNPESVSQQRKSKNPPAHPPRRRSVQPADEDNQEKDAEPAKPSSLALTQSSDNNTGQVSPMQESPDELPPDDLPEGFTPLERD